MSNISKLLLKDSLYAPIIENASIVGAQLEMNIFLVGGFIRDLLLNRTLIDIDLMVEGNASEFAKKLSEKLKIKKVIEFEKFHTYRIPCDDLEIDIAEARKESYESTSRKPSKVVSASINEDLERRDFTVNAIAVSINKKDLKVKLLMIKLKPDFCFLVFPFPLGGGGHQGKWHSVGRFPFG